jgi:2,5-diamino-6-(ribosylamino)-4(3H)-pyrimidinone 5'-phosphate reductase
MGFETAATDTGGVLAAALLEAGLVNEIWLMVAPEIVGKKAVNLFRNVETPVKLTMTKCEQIKDHVLLVYEVHKKGS